MADTSIINDIVDSNKQQSIGTLGNHHGRKAKIITIIPAPAANVRRHSINVERIENTKDGFSNSIDTNHQPDHHRRASIVSDSKNHIDGSSSLSSKTEIKNELDVSQSQSSRHSIESSRHSIDGHRRAKAKIIIPSSDNIPGNSIALVSNKNANSPSIELTLSSSNDIKELVSNEPVKDILKDRRASLAVPPSHTFHHQQTKKDDITVTPERRRRASLANPQQYQFSNSTDGTKTISIQTTERRNSQYMDSNSQNLSEDVPTSRENNLIEKANESSKQNRVPLYKVVSIDDKFDKNGNPEQKAIKKHNKMRAIQPVVKSENINSGIQN